MLPDVGITEYIVIAAVALIFIGPKDLPKVMRVLGQWVAKMRGMAADFRASFEDMARQSELDDLRREVEAMRAGQLVDPMKALGGDDASHTQLTQTFADIEAGLKDGGAVLHPPMSHQAAAAADAAQAVAEPIVTGPAEVAKPAPTRKPRASRARSKA